MKRALVITLIMLSTLFQAKADWYGDKYSMFIHYGLYSIPGGVFNGAPVTKGYSEQILTFGIGFSDWYEAYTKQFTAKHFDADEIVALAKVGGMRSIVITSKHHDGFCLFSTETTTYNSVQATPAKRDLLKELSDACHREGIGFGVYFSLIDWHYPYAVPYTSHNADPITPEHHEYNKRQVRELLTQYGQVNELWFDMGSLTKAQSEELYHLVHELQPQCMVSGRLGNDFADFSVMADNEYPDYQMVMPWQTAASMFDETWGYRSWQQRGSVEDKVAEKLTSLIKVVAYGGKYLLNIGPRGDGSVVPFEAEVIRAIGDFIRPISEAIYDTKPAPYPRTPDLPMMTSSQDGKALYLFMETGQTKVTLPATKSQLRKAEMLSEGGRIVRRKQHKDGRIELTITPKDTHYQVVKLTFNQPLEPIKEVLPAQKSYSVQEATPLYAHSAIDYYTGFRSIVGYQWQLPEPYPHQFIYPAALRGREIEVNGQPLTLQSAEKSTIRTPFHLLSIGRLYEGVARGRFGVMDEGYIETELVDSLWRPSRVNPLRPYKKELRDRGAIHFRQELFAQEATTLPLEITYNDGLLLYLNGTYIDGAIHRDGGKLFFLLPLQVGENIITLRFYNRWGDEVQAVVSVPPTYELYRQALPADLIKEGRLQIRKAKSFNEASPAHLSTLRLEN